MFVDSQGMAVQPVRPTDLDEDSIELLRDITMIRMHAKRTPVKLIAQFLGMKRMTLHDRLAKIPREVYEHYRRIPVGELVPAFSEGAEA